MTIEYNNNHVFVFEWFLQISITNLLGVINFEIDKGSISNLNSQFDESSTMEEKVNMLDGIDLKMNIIPPAQPAMGPVMNNDFKVQVILCQSLLLSFQCKTIITVKLLKL